MKQMHIRGIAHVNFHTNQRIAAAVNGLCEVCGVRSILHVATSPQTMLRAALDYFETTYTQHQRGDYTIIQYGNRSTVLYPVDLAVDDVTPIIEIGATFWNVPTDEQITAALETVQDRIYKIL